MQQMPQTQELTKKRNKHTNKQTNNTIEAHRKIASMQKSNPTGALYVIMHPDFEFLLSQRSECCNIRTKLLLHHQGNSGQIQQLTNQTTATNATNTTVNPKNAINKQTNKQRN